MSKAKSKQEVPVKRVALQSTFHPVLGRIEKGKAYMVPADLAMADQLFEAPGGKTNKAVTDGGDKS